MVFWNLAKDDDRISTCPEEEESRDSERVQMWWQHYCQSVHDVGVDVNVDVVVEYSQCLWHNTTSDPMIFCTHHSQHIWLVDEHGALLQY